MPLSLIQRAKRALVSVLLKLAFDYGVAVDINRESDDRALLQCYRRVVKKVHPDKGGHKKTFQTLQVAKEAWDTARQGARPAGNPALVEGQLVLASAQSKQYRVHAQAVLLTYSGKWSLQLWAAFVAWVRCSWHRGLLAVGVDIGKTESEKDRQTDEQQTGRQQE